MRLSVGAVMDDPNNIPGGLTTIFGAAGASIIVAITWLRRVFSRDSVDRSADVAYRALIENLRAEITLERARNNELMVSRDMAISQIDALRQQVYALGTQVAQLQREIASMSRSP